MRTFSQFAHGSLRFVLTPETGADYAVEQPASAGNPLRKDVRTFTTRTVRDPFFFDLARMEHAVRELRFDDLFSRMLGRDGGVRPLIPACDVLESGEHDVALVDLPGVVQEKITLEAEDNMLTISGKRTRPDTDEARRLERPIGEFVRSLALPHDIDAREVAAHYEDGVLEIRVPKPAEYRRKPERIALDRGGVVRKRAAKK